MMRSREITGSADSRGQPAEGKFENLFFFFFIVHLMPQTRPFMMRLFTGYSAEKSPGGRRGCNPVVGAVHQQHWNVATSFISFEPFPHVEDGDAGSGTQLVMYELVVFIGGNHRRVMRDETGRQTRRQCQGRPDPLEQFTDQNF